MTQSYSPKMPQQANEQLIQMMSNEQILMSDKMMKLEVENKELFHKYHKIKKTFYELLERHNELRERAGLEYVDKYDYVEKAGLLDDAE
jgi:transcription initiation factor TFIID subunit TAF12